MVSEKIKAAIAVTGLVSMLGFMGADQYRQHKNDKIKQQIPEVQITYNIEKQLLSLSEQLQTQIREKNYSIDQFVAKYQLLAEEYATLLSQEKIYNARAQIDANNKEPPAVTALLLIAAVSIAYTMLNSLNKKEEPKQPQPAEATTA